MNKIKFLAIIILMSMILSDHSYSQTKKGAYTASFEYSTAFNIGRSSDFLESPGFLGGSLTFKSFIQNNIAAGISFSWNVMSKEDTQWLTELTNGAVYGPQARYINYAPILANISYYFNKNNRSKVIPYIQANVGAYYILQRLQLGVRTADNDNWHFGGGPEAGLLINLGNTVGLTINGKYNYAVSSGINLAGKDDNSYSFFNANIGLAYVR